MELNNYTNNQTRKTDQNSYNSLYEKFYPYYSKPKIIPILKKAAGTLAILSCFFFVFANITGYLFANSDELKKIYIDVFWSAFIWFHFFIVFLIAFQNFKVSEKKIKKYFISFWYPLLTILYTGFWIWNITTAWKAIAENDIKHVFFLVWKILTITHMVLFVMISGAFIVAFLSNPKIDRERILKFQKELINWQKAKAKGEEYEMNMEDLD